VPAADPVRFEGLTQENPVATVDPDDGTRPVPTAVPTIERDRTRLTGGERREVFLDAAAAIIVEHGVEALTMEGIATRTGVSKALGYRYFANREDVLIALFDRENVWADARIRVAAADAGPFEERLRAIIEVFLDHMDRSGRLLTVLQHADLGQGPYHQRREERVRAVEDYFADLVTAEYGVPRTQAALAVSVFIAGVSAMVQVGDERRLPRREVADTFVRLCLAGLDGLRPA
jgi:AcrR family transcriptional regulator